MLGVYEYPSSKKWGSFRWAPKHKVVIFSKVAITVLVWFQLFVETIFQIKLHMCGILKKIKVSWIAFSVVSN
jgi:hypothetical protein